MTKAWLSCHEAQTYAGLGRTKLWEILNSGEVQGARIGRRVLISKSSLQEFLERNPYTETALTKGLLLTEEPTRSTEEDDHAWDEDL